MEARKRKSSGSRLSKIFRKRAFRKIKSGNPEQDSEAKVKKVELFDLQKLVAKLRKLKKVQVPPIAKYLGAAGIVILAIIIFAGGGDDPVVDEQTGQETSAGTGQIQTENPIEPSEIGEVVNLTEGETEMLGENTGQEAVVTESGPPKDHVIVIASYKGTNQLKPVAEYFAGKGIETEIQPANNGWYHLITKDRFVKPGDPKSNIADQKKRIAVIGKGYKPPDGFLPFRFDSVYPMKVNE